MLSTHDRNQVYKQILQPGALTREPFLRKAAAALRRLHYFNWFVLAISILGLALAWRSR